jgi:hypothetical protein
MLDTQELARFLDKVDKTEHQRCKDHGCWMWTASTNTRGYGKFYLRGRLWLSTIVAYRHFKGDYRPGLFMCHQCPYEQGDLDNRRCINPDHLLPQTPKQNSEEGYVGTHQTVKTHCPKGHEYTDNNTRLYKGRRFCRACDRLRPRRVASK